MIITKLKLKNWYSFADCELDLTYPRKVVDSTIPYEYLPGYENIRYKRVIILTGANASGKTSFAKIVLAILDFMDKKAVSVYFPEGMHPNKDNLEFSIEFIDKVPESSDPYDNPDNKYFGYNYLHNLYIKVYKTNNPALKDEVAINFCYKNVEIKKSDSMSKLRNILNNLDESFTFKNRDANYISNINKKSSQALEAVNKFKDLDFKSMWSFLYNDLLDEKNLDEPTNVSKEVLEAVLKTFDPSISSVEEVEFTDKKFDEYEFYINFKNSKRIPLRKGGQISKKDRYLFSLGTYEAIKVAKLVNDVLVMQNFTGGTYFMDEGMSYVQSEIERSIVALIIEKMGIYSQFFYTTHNYDILDMNLPIHSYLFLKKDRDHNSNFIRAEDHFNKNDRSIINYIKNDVLASLPDTSLIDELMMRD